MISRVLILWILLLMVVPPTFAVDAGVMVTVSEDIAGRSDDVVRRSAKVKASFLGVNDLPVVIKGNESLSGDEYKGYIHALGAGFVNVITKNENWDREKGMLTLTAEVSLDDEKVQKALSRLSESEFAKKQLRQSYALMDSILSGALVDESQVAKIEVNQKAVFTTAIVRLTVKETVKAKEELLKAMAKSLRAEMQSSLPNFKITVMDASDAGIKVIANGNETINVEALFFGQIFYPFYLENKAEIHRKAGSFCLQAFRYRWSFEDKVATPEFYENKDSSDAEYIDYVKHINKVNKQYAILQLKDYPVNKEVLIKDGSSYPIEYYDQVLERPSEFLKVGICVTI